jgi:hypothetical protein
MANHKTFLSSCLLVLWFALSNATLAAPQTGWYWNPNENGRGFFVESDNGVTFIGAYLYDTDGHAMWLVAGGPNDDPYNYTGDLYNKTGGQTLFGDYAAPSNAVVVGQMSVHFSDDTHATLTWPGGTVEVERQIFGEGEPAFKPLAGWWWNPDESGSGYSLEVQGNSLFIVGFMYDDTGRPVWYYAAGPKTSDTTFHADVLQFAGGQTMGGAYHPPGVPTNIAAIDVVFNDVDDATFMFTKSTAAALEVKAVQPKHLQPQFVKLPKAYRGRITAYSQYRASATEADRWQINIDSMNLVASAEQAPLSPVPGVRALTYELQATTYQLTFTGTIGCTGSGAVTTPVPADSVTLNVFSNHTYEFNLNIPGSVVNVTLDCPGSTPDTFPFPFPGIQINNQQLTAGGSPASPIPDANLANKHASWAISLDGVFADGGATAGAQFDFSPVWK